MENSNLVSAIESILFAADRPVTVEKLLEVMSEEKPSKEEVQEALEALSERYQSEAHGVELRTAQGGFQFTTKVKNGNVVRKFLESKPFRLGRSTMETLAIIAYRQPVTRAEIDQIRGIDSSHLVRTLVEKGVVKMGGKADLPGRPVQYFTTQKFLDLVGLASVKDLPPLSELKELQGDQPLPDMATQIEEGLDRFIDTSELLADRQEELEQGLTEVEEIMKSAGDPKREIYESKEEADLADTNQEALTNFLEFARGKRWPKPTQNLSAQGGDEESVPGDEEEIEISDVIDGEDLGTAPYPGAMDEAAGKARDISQPSAQEAIEQMDREIEDELGYPDMSDAVPNNLKDTQIN